MLAFNAEPLPNGELLVFGVQNKNTLLNTIFDSNGKLYLMKLNKNAQIAWDTVLTNLEPGGYPCNVIRRSDSLFNIFWNEKSKIVAIEIAMNKNKVNISSINFSVDNFFNEELLVYTSRNLNDNGFTLFTLGSISIENKTYWRAILTGITENFQVEQKLSQNEFSGWPENTSLSQITHFFNYYFYLQPLTNRYIFNAPSGLFYAGENKPVINNKIENGVISEMLVAFHPLNSMQNIAAVAWDGENDHVYFIPQINLYNNYPSIDKLTKSPPIYDLDPNQKIAIKQVNDKFLVAGTALTGQVAIYIFDSQGNPLPKANDPEILGQTYQYQVADMDIVNQDGKQVLTIIGTTKVQHTKQRIYLIKIPVEELFTGL